MPKVFDVEFKNYQQLFNVLGYKSSFAQSQIEKQYGTLENLVMNRLKIYDIPVLQDELRQRLSKYSPVMVIKKQVISDEYDVLRACYQSLDESTKNTIIKAVAIARKVDEKNLKERLDAL